MDVKIIETGKIVTLAVITPEGIDWTSDLIGNAGESGITYDSAEGLMSGTQESVDWWVDYIHDLNQTDEDIQTMSDETGVSVSDIREAIANNTDGDYESHRSQAIQAMDELRASL